MVKMICRKITATVQHSISLYLERGVYAEWIADLFVTSSNSVAYCSWAWKEFTRVL